MIVDLSHNLHSDMPVYPGDRNVEIIPTKIHENGGYNVHSISMSSHTGTHVDAPYHVRPGGDTVDSPEVLDACIGDALVIDVSSRLDGIEITPESLGTATERIKPGDRLLLTTGWSDLFGTDDFFRNYPSLSIELTRLLIGKSVALIGIETPSVHYEKNDLIHEMLLSNGIIIVENLANLKKLGEGRVFFSAAPLKLRGIDGSTVRAYAIPK
ncbi:Kynurenine formamidase [subsurface metagenome]